MGINREVALWAMAERVEQAAGLLASKPYRDAYSRAINDNHKKNSDIEIDRLLAAGAALLEEMNES